jgi:hypothetical protein
VFVASKMEAQPVLVPAAQNGTPGQGSNGVIFEAAGGRFAVVITGVDPLTRPPSAITLSPKRRGL